MATVICVECQHQEERSFYRGYRLAEDRSSCHKSTLRRFKRGIDRYWKGNECSQHWPPVAGVDKGIRIDRPDYAWRRHDYQCPICGAQFTDTDWKDANGLWPDQRGIK